MASYQPPLETLPIFDNSVFAAVSSTTILTIAQANLLYLRKTYPDTATALETFQAGILSSSINPLLVTSSLDIGTTQTTNSINIGTNAAKAGLINLGASVSSGNYGVSIGCASGAIKLYSPVQCVSTLEGSGSTLQLGTSNSLTTGVTIGNTGANPIQIGNSTSTGTIVIDTASTLNTNSAPAIAIGTSGSIKTIKIGSSAVTQSVHLAQLDVTSNSLNNYVGTTGDMNIGNFQTSGALYLGCRSGGSTRTGGTINIGTDTTTTGQIKIGNSTATCPIVIDTGSTLNTTASPAISIGTSSSVKTIKINNSTNSVQCSSIELNTSSINNIVNDTGTISIGDKQTAGILNVGVGKTGIYRTQPINIGTGIYSSGVNALVNIGSTACPVRTFGKTNLSYNSGTTVPSTISVVTGVTSVTNNIDFITGVGATAPALYDARIQAFSGNGDASNGSAVLNLYSARQEFYDYTASLIGSMGRVISSSLGSMVASSGLSVNTLYTKNVETVVGGTLTVGGAASTLNTDAIPYIAIGTAASAKWIKIGSSLGGQNNTIALGNIRMRTSPTGVEINGTSNPNTTPIFLANQQSTSALNLGCGFGPDANVIRAVGGDVNIANGPSNACNINIMNGNTTAGNVNIANGTGATQTTTVNIASGTTSGGVTIGNSANTTTINSGLTLSKPIVLGTVATANTQLGYIFTTLTTKVTIINNGGAAVPLMTIVTPSTGVWLCHYWVRLTSVLGASYNQIQTYIGGYFCGMNASGATTTVGAANNPFPTYSGSVVISLNAGVTLGVEFFINIVAGIITLDTASGMQMTRIG